MGAGQSQPSTQTQIGLGLGLGLGIPALLVIFAGWDIPTTLSLLLVMSFLTSLIWISYAELKDAEALKSAAIGTGLINGIMLFAPGIIVLLSADHAATDNYAFFMIHFATILSIISLTANVLVKLNS